VTTSSEPTALAPLPDYRAIKRRIFSVKNGKIYIGGEEITPELRDVLRDQARSLQTSQLWEILNASITNEAINLALIQSTNYDHVQFAKALHHFAHFIHNSVHTLAKE
jgi:hypothetical protein